MQKLNLFANAILKGKLVCLAILFSVFPVVYAQDLSTITPPEGYQPTESVEKYGLATALLIQDVYPWGINSNEQVLQEFGVSYDLAHSSSLASWDLSEYKFIMYASDQRTSYYQNIGANISKITEFVSNGGLLIAHVCDRGWNSGNWTGFHILPENMTHVASYRQDLTIANINHPIVRGTDGVFDIYSSNPNYFDGWNYSTHGYLTNLPVEADIIIKIEGTDYPTYVEYSYGSGMVLATMQTVEWGYSRRPRPELLRNEIRHAIAYEAVTAVEKSFTDTTLFETFLAQEAVLNDVIVSGDFNSTLDFTDFEIVTITTGSFAGKGFSKGECQTTLGGIPYTGNWQGALFLKPQERKIHLKGAISGEISATVEGYLTESVSESGVYDQYQATWRIGRLGFTVTSATINLNGTLSYQSSSEFPNAQLYVLQSNIEGTISGHYSGPFSTVLTHLRVTEETNPYWGEGFSIISYVSESGSGEGWTYDNLVSPGRVRLKGLFNSPLFGIVTATLNESELPRTLSVNIVRVDLGLPPMADLQVKVWGPGRVSPGQTVNYLIEYRNDGLKAADYITVGIEIPDSLEYVSSSEGGIYLPSESPAEELWFEDAVKPKTKDYKTLTVRIPWGLPQGTNFGLSAFTGSTTPEIRDGFCPCTKKIIPTLTSPKIGTCSDGPIPPQFTEKRLIEQEYPLSPLVEKSGDGTCKVTFRCQTLIIHQERRCFLTWLPFSPRCDFFAELFDKSCENWATVKEVLGLKEKTLTLDCDLICSIHPESCEDSKKDTWNSVVVTAHDPNIKYGPEGYVQPGQKLDYKVEYENEGEGIAFGVYFTDILDEDLDDATLEIGPVIDVETGAQIAPSGIYNLSTRTITWFVGEVGPGEGGYANFSVNIRSDAPEGTEVINYATVYFPSVPEITRTNGVVSIIAMVGAICGDVTHDNGNPVANVTVKVIDSDNNQVGDPIVTGADGSFYFDLLPVGTYSVMIVTPLGYSVSPGETQTGIQVTGYPCTEVYFVLTPTITSNDCRTIGYWKHQFDVYLSGQGDAQESSSDLEDYLDLVHLHFDVLGIYTDLESFDFVDAKNVLTVSGGQLMEDRAKQQLFALLLNFASGKIGNETVVSEDGRVAAEAVTYAAILISDGDPENDELAKTICDLINNRQMVEAGIIPESPIRYRVTVHGGRPTEYTLNQNYPNPFNPVTQISYALPRDGHVKLQIYNLLGQKVATLVDEYQQAGQKTMNWEAKDLSSGIYFYKLTADDFTATKKMVLTK